MNKFIFWKKYKLLAILSNLFSLNNTKIEKKEVLEVVKVDDETSRFIMQSNRIRKDGTIRHTAFMPYIPKNKEVFELSLFWTTGILIKTVWTELANIVTKTDPPNGRGIVFAKHYYQNSLNFELTPESHYLHIDAVNWPIEKGHQTLIAQKLAKISILEKNPSTN